MLTYGGAGTLYLPGTLGLVPSNGEDLKLASFGGEGSISRVSFAGTKGRRGTAERDVD